MTRDQFLKQLAALEAALGNQKAELELTVRDRDLDLEGYVVVWNSGPGRSGPLGPCGKGGTRITPTVSLGEVSMLAQRMALKNAAAGLAMGGAKSGLRGDPDSPGFEAKYRRFVQLVRPILCENGGIFGGFGFDIGARPEHPVWAASELGSGRSFTGKPLAQGGTDYDREGIAGLGVAVAARTAFEVDGKSFEGARIAVQGLGAMGAAVIRYATGYGASLQAISDPRIGGSYSVGKDGSFSPEIVASIIAQDFNKTGVLLKAMSAKHTERLDEVLYEQADILFPCAVQDVISMENVDRIRAGYVVEGANNPTSREAQRSLFARGIVLIPDFIANPGGIIAAYVEMTSKLTPEENVRTRGNPEQAKKLTEERISANVRDMLELARALQVETVDAARFQTLSKVAGAGASA